MTDREAVRPGQGAEECAMCRLAVLWAGGRRAQWSAAMLRSHWSGVHVLTLEHSFYQSDECCSCCAYTQDWARALRTQLRNCSRKA